MIVAVVALAATICTTFALVVVSLATQAYVAVPVNPVVKVIVAVLDASVATPLIVRAVIPVAVEQVALPVVAPQKYAPPFNPVRTHLLPVQVNMEFVVVLKMGRTISLVAVQAPCGLDPGNEPDRRPARICCPGVKNQTRTLAGWAIATVPEAPRCTGMRVPLL